MGDILRFPPASRRARRWICFERGEMARLLTLYSARVAEGVWRDYAIDPGESLSAFSIFRHASESPIYTVVKFAAGKADEPLFALFAGPRRLRRARDLGEIIDYLRDRPTPPP